MPFPRVKIELMSIVLVIGMVLLTLANIMFSVSRSTEMFIAARAIEGVSSAATWSAGLALLADTYGRRERGLKLGLAMSVTAGITSLASHTGFTTRFSRQGSRHMPLSECPGTLRGIKRICDA